MPYIKRRPISVLSVIRALALFWVIVLSAFAVLSVSKGSPLNKTLLLFEKSEPILRKIGFNGMIHSYKNYLLRAEEAYLDRFLETSSTAIAHLSELREIMDPSLRPDIDIIAATVAQYQKNAAVVKQMWADGYGIPEIDRQVRIDDAPADAAFARIQRHQAQLMERSRDAIASIQNSVLFGVLLLALTDGIKMVRTHRRRRRAVDLQPHARPLKAAPKPSA